MARDMAQVKKAIQRMIKTRQNIIGTIYWASVTLVKCAICTEPKGH